MLLALTFRLLAAVFGTALHILLAILFARKRPAALPDRLALALIAAAGIWHASGAIAIFHHAVAGRESALLLEILNQTGILVLAVIPALVLHVSALWCGAGAVAPALGYAAIPFAWWTLESARPGYYGAWLAVALAGAAALCARAARRSQAVAAMRAFLVRFGAALIAIPVAGWIGGSGSVLLAAATLAPPLVLAWYIYRYNLFGLQIAPRLIFALQMGAVFALYLLIVRRLAGFFEDEFEAFGPLVEVALIIAAAMVWLPLYGWMSRFLSKRTTLYAAFSKRLIEEAARVVDLPERVGFLAGEVGRTFGLHRVLLVTGDDNPLLGRFGPQVAEDAPLPARLAKLAALARLRRADVVRATGTGDAETRTLLALLGFNCMFPLWYEDRLNGLLLLDTSPRLFLGEDESILVALSGQISHSIETGRIVAEKISLERALAHQEHLATLGRAAATLAHEVKNPLSSIKTLTQLMREDPEVESRYSRDLGFILSEVDRLNRTVQQLLSYARPASTLRDEVNLSQVLDSTAEVLAREHAPGGIRIEHWIEPRLMLRQANTEALQQVVLNVALNAIQASSPGSVVRLEARTTPAADIMIQVTDEGPGIPAEVREKMFEPFFTTKQKGTGLGLAIVRKNLQQMRGVIEVQSPMANGRGTRVTVTLPSE